MNRHVSMIALSSLAGALQDVRIDYYGEAEQIEHAVEVLRRHAEIGNCYPGSEPLDNAEGYCYLRGTVELCKTKSI